MITIPRGINLTKRLLPEGSRATPPRPDEQVTFGRTHTDHMLVCDFDPDKGGWQTPEIVPFGPFSFTPDAVVFHYGQQIFEGMKAYRAEDGTSGIYLFRPDQNAERFHRSATLMGMEPVPVELFLACIRELVLTDQQWVLPSPGSLYIRPMLIPLDTGVSYRASRTYRFCVIMSPAKAYFTKEQGVSVYVERERVRAVRGGVGEAKAGGNYGGSVAVLSRAKDAGADHVLWLDGVERKYVEEVGAMNVMFAYSHKIVTPALSGSILRGVTRLSLIELARSKGQTIVEERVSLDQVIADAKSGKLKEAFGVGTAAVVSPIRALVDGTEQFIIGDGVPGPVGRSLKADLEGLQTGARPDPFGWRVKL